MVPVSVIIPCYRCCKTIVRAVESVANQTVLPSELILVDDASDDETLSLVETIRQKYGSWIKIEVLQHNLGAAAARNRGWSIAKQPYIAFLDSDDAWHPRKIEIQYKYMSDRPEVVLTGHLHEDASDKKRSDNSILVTRAKKITNAHILLTNPFVTPSVMLKRDILFRFNEGSRYMEDHLLWMELVCENMDVRRLDVNLATIFKPIYGSSGLSANLYLMEKAELSNYRYLNRNGKLNYFLCVLLQIISLLKFVKRLLIVYLARRVLGFR